MRYPQPKNEDEFEEFVLVLFREHWKLPTLQRFGKRGERQYGVDIIDTAPGETLRAIQCKHHEPTKTLPPAELNAEVEKAKQLPELSISEFVIVTSARKSEAAQRRIIALNRTRDANKQTFVVQLLTWEDLEVIIDSCPSAQAFLLPKFAEAIRRMPPPEELKTSHPPTSSEAETGSAELTEVRELLAKGQVQLASFLLTRIRQQTWDKLPPRQRARWCTLSADVKIREGLEAEAAKFLLEAKTHQPDDDNSLANEIVAYELLGETARAFELAEDVVKKRPHLAAAYASALRTAPRDRFLSLLAEVPKQFDGDADVWIAALSQPDNLLTPERAEELARKAIGLAPQDGRGWSALGEILWRTEERKIDLEGVPTASPVDAGRIDEAIRSFTRFGELAKANGVPEVEGVALMRRGVIKAWNGDLEAAWEDIQEASRLAPTNSSVLVARARIAADRGKHDESIETLRQVVMREAKDDEAKFFLGLSLRRRGLPADRTEAVAIFSELGKTSEIHVEASNDLVLEILAEAGRISDARSQLSAVGSRVESCFAKTWDAGLNSLDNNSDQASASATAALEAITSSTSRSTLRRLARLLGSLGRFSDALAVWEKLVLEGIPNDDGLQLVNCASRLGRDDRVLSFCAKAREQGILDKRLVQRELVLLDRYDPELAIKILKELISKTPDDWGARVYLVNLALRNGKRELAHEYLAKTPDVTSVQADEGRAVVDGLIQLGKTEEAIACAYELLRTHFNDAHAHRAFRDAMLFQQRTEETDAADEPEISAAGVAVALTEDGNPEKWFVLEDSKISATVEREFSPDSPIGRRLIGKRVGDSVALTDAPGLGRTAEVKALVSKYVYRLRDVLDQWQYRFPDDQELWMLKVTKPGTEEPDFNSLFELMKHQESRVSEAANLYRNKLVPIHLFAVASAKTDIEATAYLASEESIEIRCATGAQSESVEAAAALNAASVVVLDLTALTTLVLLDELECLRDLRRAGKTLVVSHATMAAVRHFADEVARRTQADGLLDSDKTGPVLVQTPADARAALRANAEGFRKTVEEVCEIRPSTLLASFDEKVRKEGEHALGVAGLEATALASVAGAVLWSDDYIVGLFGRERFGAKRVWTQAVIRWLTEQGVVAAARSARASSRLVVGNYTFTSVSPDVFRFAANEADWDPARTPLKEMLRYLSLPNIQIEGVVVLAAIAAAHCSLDTPLPERRQAFVQAVAESLARRPDANESLALFETALPRAFGLNVVAARDAVRTFRAWKIEYARRLRKP